jgi:hypothetical protein
MTSSLFLSYAASSSSSFSSFGAITFFIVISSRFSDSVKDKSKLLAKEGEVNFKIYDEWLIEEDAKKQNTKSPNSLEAVIAEYRNLRERIASITSDMKKQDSSS